MWHAQINSKRRERAERAVKMDEMDGVSVRKENDRKTENDARGCRNLRGGGEQKRSHIDNAKINAFRK